MVVTTRIGDLKRVLRDPMAKDVKEPFYSIYTESQIIYVVNPGSNGVEFNKTIGFFNNYPYVTNFQCLFGHGLMLIQRNDSIGEAKEFKLVSLNMGKQVDLPAGSGICLVNTGANVLVVLQNSQPDKEYIDCKAIISKQGLAYYVLDKNGEIVFEENPRYKIHPQIMME